MDVANVMGARADGWWRDRAGAALRLGQEVAALARSGGGPGGEPAGEWVLVLEGRARAAAPGLSAAAPVLASGASRVRAVSAPGSGDDAIVGVVAEAAARDKVCLVVTADRELRRRCEELNASVAGPGWLLRLLSGLRGQPDDRERRKGD